MAALGRVMSPVYVAECRTECQVRPLLGVPRRCSWLKEEIYAKGVEESLGEEGGRRGGQVEGKKGRRKETWGRKGLEGKMNTGEEGGARGCRGRGEYKE